MSDPQRRYRKMAPPAERDLISKIDKALAAEGKGRQLWYWAPGQRDRVEASALIVETDGRLRPVSLAALADELGCDRSDAETTTRQAPLLSPIRQIDQDRVDPHDTARK
jgi:hypothetical protein